MLLPQSRGRRLGLPPPVVSMYSIKLRVDCGLPTTPEVFTTKSSKLCLLLSEFEHASARLLERHDDVLEIDEAVLPATVESSPIVEERQLSSSLAEEGMVRGDAADKVRNGEAADMDPSEELVVVLEEMVCEDLEHSSVAAVVLQLSFWPEVSAPPAPFTTVGGPRLVSALFPRGAATPPDDS